MKIVMKRIVMLSGFLGCMITGQIFGAANAETPKAPVGDRFSDYVNTCSGPVEIKSSDKISLLHDEILGLNSTVEPSGRQRCKDVKKVLQKIYQVQINLDPLGEDDVITSEVERLSALWVDSIVDPQMWEVLRARREYFYSGCALGAAIGICTVVLKPLELYRKDRYKIIKKYSGFNVEIATYNKDLERLNMEHSRYSDSFPFAAPVPYFNIVQKLDCTTEGGLIKNSLKWWYGSSCITGIGLCLGIAVRDAFAAEQLYVVHRLQLDHIENRLAFIKGMALGGLAGATTAFAGLLVYAGYKKIVGR
jgi:hypothetical protein